MDEITPTRQHTLAVTRRVRKITPRGKPPKRTCRESSPPLQAPLRYFRWRWCRLDRLRLSSSTPAVPLFLLGLPLGPAQQRPQNVVATAPAQRPAAAQTAAARARGAAQCIAVQHEKSPRAPKGHPSPDAGAEAQALHGACEGQHKVLLQGLSPHQPPRGCQPPLTNVPPVSSAAAIVRCMSRPPPAPPRYHNI